jgi:ribosome-associated protein
MKAFANSMRMSNNGTIGTKSKRVDPAPRGNQGQKNTGGASVCRKSRYRGGSLGQDRISRTQKKKEDRALQKLGEALVALPPDQLERIDMPDELMDAVRFAAGTTRHGARRRQLQYIGALMRKVDPEPIRRALDGLSRGDVAKTLSFKRVEQWRQRLVAGDGDLMEEILGRCPGAERQRLAQLVRNARKEAGAGPGVKSSRQLFRYLRQVSEGGPV